MTSRTAAISSTFIWRRVHSLMGLWLVLYLFEHLLVNSQATLWIGDDGSGFVKLVNALESLPYLQVIEMVFIGLPLLVHLVWGVQRIFQAKTNSSKSDGSTPALKYERNRAFTWQRLTSWILLFGVLGHVIQMRFINFPEHVAIENQKQFFVPVTFDEGLYSLSGRLQVALFNREQIAAIQKLSQRAPTPELPKTMKGAEYNPEKYEVVNQIQMIRGSKEWVEKLASYRIRDNQVVAVAATPGTAMLLMVRDTFKQPLMILLYTIFVVAAAFHAFNGFWTSLITWGMVLSYRSQKAMIPVGWLGVALLSFLGLAAIWGSYFINLRK